MSDPPTSVPIEKVIEVLQKIRQIWEISVRTCEPVFIRRAERQ